MLLLNLDVVYSWGSMGVPLKHQAFFELCVITTQQILLFIVISARILNATSCIHIALTNCLILFREVITKGENQRKPMCTPCNKYQSLFKCKASNNYCVVKGEIFVSCCLHDLCIFIFLIFTCVATHFPIFNISVYCLYDVRIKKKDYEPVS